MLCVCCIPCSLYIFGLDALISFALVCLSRNGKHSVCWSRVPPLKSQVLLSTTYDLLPARTGHSLQPLLQSQRHSSEILHTHVQPSAHI